MAINEHKNLDDANRHNPKGYEVAINNTVLSKDNTPGSTSVDGQLVWLPKSSLKVDTPVFRGYSTLATNYQYPDTYDANNKSPFQLDVDYGSATISSGTTVDQKLFFKIADYMVKQDATISTAVLQIAADGTDAFTVALVKYTPAAAVTSYPVVLFEKSCTPASADLDAVVSYSLVAADFDVTTLTAGDHLFIMVKANAGAGVGQEVLITTTAEIGYSY
jgi:hypothetical protein